MTGERDTIRVRRAALAAASAHVLKPGELLWHKDTDHSGQRLNIGDDGATVGGVPTAPDAGISPNGYRTGAWAMPSGIVDVPAGGAVTTGIIYYIAFYCGAEANFDQLIARVSVADAGGSTRLAIYDNGADGMPGSLIAESGAMSTAATGEVVYAPGGGIDIYRGMYFLGFQSSGTAQYYRSGARSLVSFYQVLVSPPHRRSHYRQTWTFGAFPSTATVSASTNTSFPVPYLRSS